MNNVTIRTEKLQNIQGDYQLYLVLQYNTDKVIIKIGEKNYNTLQKLINSMKLESSAELELPPLTKEQIQEANDEKKQKEEAKKHRL